jgi:hypothetical protein
VQQDEHDDDDRKDHLKAAENGFHGQEDSSAGIRARVLMAAAPSRRCN